LAIIISEIIGKFFYFNSFKLFTFEIGYLSLIEVGLFSLFILIAQKLFTSFEASDDKVILRTKPKLQVLYLLLSFATGLHFLGGEFQNFFILKKNFGPFMDMATFYDGTGHFFLFFLTILIIFFLVKVELRQQNMKPLTNTDFKLLFFQGIIASFFVAITIIKSAFILLCIFPLLVLTLFFFVLAGKPRHFLSKNYPLYTFFFTLFLFSSLLLVIWFFLPHSLKQPIIKEFISLGPDHKIETSLGKYRFSS
jgi:hypothetical protein